MARFTRFLRRATTLPGVPQARHVTERAVAPYLRADVQSLHHDLVDALERLGAVERRLDAIEEHMPAVLNAIVSTNGNARLTQRELTALREQVAELHREVGAASLAAGAAVSEPA